MYNQKDRAEENSLKGLYALIPIILVIVFAVIALVIFGGPSGKDLAQNEKVAVEMLGALSLALDKYKKDNVYYPETLSSLGGGLLSTQYLENADIVSNEYPMGPTGLFAYSYSGYWYMYQPADDNNRPILMSYKNPGEARISGYAITAFPIKPNRTGVRRFKIFKGGELFIERLEEGGGPQLTPYAD